MAQQWRICLQCRSHRRHRFNSWVGKIPWRRKWQPTLVFLPGESHRHRSLVGYSPEGCKELDMTEYTHTHTSDYTETTTYQELKRNNHKCKWKVRSWKKKRNREQITIYLLSAIINIRKQWYDVAKENNFQLKYLFLAALLFKNIYKIKILSDIKSTRVHSP